MKLPEKLFDSFFNSLDKLLTINQTSLGLNEAGGIILSCFYLSRLTDNNSYEKKAIMLLESAFESTNFQDPSLNKGLSGIGLLLEHLNQYNFISIDTDTILSGETDNYLHSTMLNQLFLGNFNYFTGALGSCKYFLKRYMVTKNDKSIYKNYITQFLVFLENRRLFNLENHRLKLDPQLISSKGCNSETVNHLSRMVNLLIELNELNEFKPLAHAILDYYSGLLFDCIKYKKNIDAVSTFSIMQAGKQLENKDYVDVATNIFDMNKFMDSDNMFSIYDISRIYYQLYKKTESQLYKELQIQYQSNFFKNLDNIDLEEYDLGIWTGLSGIVIRYIWLKKKGFKSLEEFLC